MPCSKISSLNFDLYSYTSISHRRTRSSWPSCSRSWRTASLKRSGAKSWFSFSKNFAHSHKHCNLREENHSSRHSTIWASSKLWKSHYRYSSRIWIPIPNYETVIVWFLDIISIWNPAKKCPDFICHLKNELFRANVLGAETQIIW